MTRSRVLAPAIVALCLVLTSCGDDNVPPSPTPTPTPTPTGTPAGQVSRIQLTAPPNMTAIGDTVKLSLTAFYTNGTSRDVAAEAIWTIDLPSVLRVTNGEATALSFGATYLWARFDRFTTSSFKVQVTPPGTFAVVGGTREPGMSGLSGVTVTNPPTGLSMVSDAGGTFTLGALTDRTLLLQKAGYEDATYMADVTATAFEWLAMQRLIRMQAGDTASVRIAPHDMDYAPANATVPGERCSPCKRIRLTNTPGSLVRVTLKWTPVNVGLKLWNDDGTFAAAPGTAGLIERDISSDKTEVWLYVGQSPAAAALQYVDVQVIVAKIGL